MYLWKVWFRDPHPIPGLPQAQSVQCHRWAHSRWKRVVAKPDAGWRWLLLLDGSLADPDGHGPLRPGDSLLLPPDCEPGKGAAPDASAEFVYLLFRPMGLEQACKNLAERVPRWRCDPATPPADRLFRWKATYERMVAANPKRADATPLAEVDPGFGLRMVGDLFAALARDASSGLADPLVQRALQLVEQSRNPGLTVQHWAHLLGCSRKHLADRFQAAGLSPPGRWLAQRRIAEAERRLADGDRPGAVATDLGFADAGSLARARRRHQALG